MGIGGLVDAISGGAGGASDGGPLDAPHEIKVDGSALSDDVQPLVSAVTVVDRLRMPDSCVIVFRDFKHKVIEEAKIKIGSTVEISIANPGTDVQKTLFKGEVTSIEADYDALGMRAVVRGYDKLHRLTAGRRTRTYANSTYADIVETIVTDAGLSAHVQGTGAALDHVIQANISDLEFLYQISARVGYDIGIDDDMVSFTKPTQASSAPGKGDKEAATPTQLVWGKTMLEFHGRVSGVGQVTDVKVRGWDVKRKEAVIGKAGAATTSATLDAKPTDLASAIGGETLVVTNHPVDDQSSADDLASAVAEHVASAAYEATALSIGSPDLKAGQAVTISEVDKHLAGDWVISTARHEFGTLPYRTHLEFSGRQDRSLFGLVSGGSSDGGSGGSIPGVVVGIVTDNKDPEDQGRVKIQYPWLDDKAESYWARLATIGAGKDYGIVWVPQKGDEVLVAFEQGDIAHPYVIGSLWNGVDKPKAEMMSNLTKDGEVTRTALISRRGHSLIFQDNDDTDGIILTTEDTKIQIYLDESQSNLLLQSDGDMEVAVTGDLKIKADGKINMEARGDMTLKGSKVAIN